jgi:hypothetical protein
LQEIGLGEQRVVRVIFPPAFEAFQGFAGLFLNDKFAGFDELAGRGIGVGGVAFDEAVVGQFVRRLRVGRSSEAQEDQKQGEAASRHAFRIAVLRTWVLGVRSLVLGI